MGLVITGLSPHQAMVTRRLPGDSTSLKSMATDNTAALAPGNTASLQQPYITFTPGTAPGGSRCAARSAASQPPFIQSATQVRSHKASSTQKRVPPLTAPETASDPHSHRTSKAALGHDSEFIRPALLALEQLSYRCQTGHNPGYHVLCWDLRKGASV